VRCNLLWHGTWLRSQYAGTEVLLRARESSLDASSLAAPPSSQFEGDLESDAALDV
jgi:hypothetical protein